MRGTWRGKRSGAYLLGNPRARVFAKSQICHDPLHFSACWRLKSRGRGEAPRGSIFCIKWWITPPQRWVERLGRLSPSMGAVPEAVMQVGGQRTVPVWLGAPLRRTWQLDPLHHAGVPAVHDASVFCRLVSDASCWPASSKLDVDSQRSKARFSAGHSRSITENQAVSRVRLL